MNSQSSLRELAVEYENLTRPDGSAVFAQGKSVVQCAVYGPGEVRQNKELPNKSLVEVIFRPKSGIPGCAEKVNERFIRNTLECAIMASLHPRTAITIIIQELQNSGSLLACCINAAMLALLDSGLNLKFSVAAVAAIITQDDAIDIDPTIKLEQASKACLTMAFNSKDEKLLAFTGRGSYSESQMFACVKVCRKTTAKIFEFYRDSVKRRFAKELQEEPE